MPFDTDDSDPAAVMMMHVSDAPRPLRELVPSVPADVEGWIMEALEKKPQMRPSARDLAARLHALAPERPEALEPAVEFHALDESPTAPLEVLPPPADES